MCRNPMFSLVTPPFWDLEQKQTGAAVHSVSSGTLPGSPAQMGMATRNAEPRDERHYPCLHACFTPFYYLTFKFGGSPFF